MIVPALVISVDLWQMGNSGCFCQGMYVDKVEFNNMSQREE